MTTASALLLPSASAQHPDPAADIIELAIVGPMVGTSFSVGMQFKAGVHAALASLDQGLLLGRPVRVSEHNDSCTRIIAERVAQDLVQNPPHVVIGHSCSSTTVVAAPVYARHGVLQITPSSTAPRVTEMGISSIFRMIGHDDLQGELAAEKIATQYAGRRVGILRYANDYSMGLTGNAIAGLAGRGIEPAVILEMSSSASSYLDDIMELLDHDVGVLYVTGGALDTGVFVRQARQMAVPFDIIGSDTLVSPIFAETAGAASNDVAFTFFPELAANVNSDRMQAASVAIRAQGMEPDGYTLLSYAAIEIWIEGVRRAGSVDTNAVAAAIRQAPLDTIIGRISFDDKGDIHTEYPAFAWHIWQDGQRVAVD